MTEYNYPDISTAMEEEGRKTIETYAATLVGAERARVLTERMRPLLAKRGRK